MSLQLETGEIVVVENATINKVWIRLHSNTEHRTRFKTWTETKYESTKWEERTVEVDLLTNADATKSIKDNSITAWYLAIKTLEEFSTAIDV